MRLAFDKPTIIIKDDKTPYSFDTSPIEHIEYPRDLRFSKIVDFKSKLAEKIKATYDKSTTDPNYTTFLKNFGEFKVAKIEKKEVSSQVYILDELKNLRISMQRLERRQMNDMDILSSKKFNLGNSRRIGEFNYCMRDVSLAHIEDAFKAVERHPVVEKATLEYIGDNHAHIIAKLHDPDGVNELENWMNERYPKSKNLKRARNP